ncbi:MAG: S1 family peptidase [Deltaproteobacteria bacterium]|nr:S1 family peptidase [Deltaproteobacteria bacterium]
MRRRARLSLLVLACALAMACGPAEEPGERFAGVAQSIAGGYDDHEDSAAVAVYRPPAGPLCSGALIAPNVVLTAHHCVAPMAGTEGTAVACSQTKLGEPWPAGDFYATTSFKLGTGPEHAVSEIVLPPAGDDLFCGNDVAILVLADNVDPAQAIPYEPRVEGAPEPGEEYYAIGYGATGAGTEGAGTRRRRDGLHVACVGAGCDDSEIKSSEWLGETGICSGDSGGPALDLDDRVMGVTSRGATGCDEPVYGDVYAWRQWLKDTVVLASGLGAYAAPGWTEGATTTPEDWMPVGEACTEGAECPSKRCLDDGVERYCTRPCSEQASCPKGYRCEAHGEMLCAKERAAVPPRFQRAPSEDGCAIEPPGAGGARGAPALLALVLALWAGRPSGPSRKSRG